MSHVSERPRVSCPACGHWHWWGRNGGVPAWLSTPIPLKLAYVTFAGARGFPQTAYDAAEELERLDAASPSRLAIMGMLRRLRDRLVTATERINALLGEKKVEPWLESRSDEWAPNERATAGTSSQRTRAVPSSARMLADSPPLSRTAPDSPCPPALRSSTSDSRSPAAWMEDSKSEWSKG